MHMPCTHRTPEPHTHTTIYSLLRVAFRTPSENVAYMILVTFHSLAHHTPWHCRALGPFSRFEHCQMLVAWLCCGKTRTKHECVVQLLAHL